MPFPSFKIEKLDKNIVNMNWNSVSTFIAQKNLKRRYPVNLRALIRKLVTRRPDNARTIAACMSVYFQSVTDC